MAKKSGTKHHVTIKMEDLNKMFKNDDIIPIPKGFAKNIAYLLSAHSISLNEVSKDTGNPVEATDVAPAAEEKNEQKVQVTEITDDSQ